MDNKISENYQKNMQRIIESDGSLISMNRIYEDYGRPKYKSPKRIMSYKRTKEQVEYAIKESGYEVEKVIKYTPDDILVNGPIAMLYLNQLDVKSYFHYYFGDNGLLTARSPFDAMSGMEFFDWWINQGPSLTGEDL